MINAEKEIRKVTLYDLKGQIHLSEQASGGSHKMTIPDEMNVMVIVKVAFADGEVCSHRVLLKH